MVKTVVGLFDNAHDAQDVVSDLQQNLGFGSNDVELVTQDTFAGSQSDMLNLITNEGIPSRDAHLYTEEVQRGSSLVIARTDDTRVNEVAEIMNRYNMVDLDSRREMYSQVDEDADVTGASTSTDYGSERDIGTGMSGPVGDTPYDTDYTERGRTAEASRLAGRYSPNVGTGTSGPVGDTPYDTDYTEGERTSDTSYTGTSTVTDTGDTGTTDTNDVDTGHTDTDYAEGDR